MEEEHDRRVLGRQPQREAELILDLLGHREVRQGDAVLQVAEQPDCGVAFRVNRSNAGAKKRGERERERDGKQEQQISGRPKQTKFDLWDLRPMKFARICMGEMACSLLHSRTAGRGIACLRNNSASTTAADNGEAPPIATTEPSSYVVAWGRKCASSWTYLSLDVVVPPLVASCASYPSWIDSPLDVDMPVVAAAKLLRLSCYVFTSVCCRTGGGSCAGARW